MTAASAASEAPDVAAGEDGGQVRIPVAYQYRFEDVSDVETYEQRRHRCYELAAQALINLSIAGWDTQLTHGHVGPYQNPHAWIEFRAGGSRYVWDGVLDAVIPWAHYRDHYSARRWVWYSVDDARVQVLNSGTFGPWGRYDERYERHHAAMEAAGVGVGIDWRENPAAP